jgi:hypothetical protein
MIKVWEAIKNETHTKALTFTPLFARLSTAEEAVVAVAEAIRTRAIFYS